MRLTRPAFAVAVALTLTVLAGCASDPGSDDAAPDDSTSEEQTTPGGEVTEADKVATAEQVYRDFVAATAKQGADLNVCEDSEFITADSFPDMVPTFIVEGTTLEVATWDEPGMYRVRGSVEDADGGSGGSQSQMVVKINDDGTGCVWNASGYGWK